MQSPFGNVRPPQSPEIPGLVLKIAIAVVALIVVVVVGFGATFTVHEYERGIVTTWGKVSYVANPGIGFKVPIAQDVTRLRTDIRDVKPEKAVNTYTADNQEVDILFTVFYRLPADNMLFIYTNAQDYHMRLFQMSVDRLKSEMGKINLTHFAEKRGDIGRTIKATLATDAKALGLEVTDFQLTNVDYTKTFRAAVEQAAAAKAMVETREQEKQQALRVAERAKIDAEGTANAAREKAKGEADSLLVVAQARAKATQLEGEAKATAMRAQAEALARNPVLVEMAKAEKWNGALPTAIYAGAPIPFLTIPTK